VVQSERVAMIQAAVVIRNQVALPQSAVQLFAQFGRTISVSLNAATIIAKVKDNSFDGRGTILHIG
jgi:uncharacterized lipoprotein YbaY